MTAIAVPATPGLALDTSTKIARPVAAELWDYGYRAVGRYVPLPDNRAGQDIDAFELAMLLDVGFQVWLVQHVRMPGWRPADHNAEVDATVAVTAARAAGYPAAHIFLDLEGIDGTADETKAFAEGWASTMARLGQPAGVYCGYQNPLGAQGLYLLHGVSTYWSDAGHRSVMTRGCAIHQGPEKTIAGIRVDVDTISVDMLGDLPLFATAAPAAVAA